MVQRFDVGARMSEMAVHNGVAYLAGQVAGDGSQDISGQTRQVLAAIDALLARRTVLQEFRAVDCNRDDLLPAGLEHLLALDRRSRVAPDRGSVSRLERAHS